MLNDKNISINITSGTIIKIILFLLLFVSLYILRDLILVILTAVVIASAIEPLTKWFTNRKIPRLISVIFIYAALIIVVVGSLLLLLPPLLDEASNLSSTFPQYLNSLNLWNPVDGVSGVNELSKGFSVSDIILELRNNISNATGGLFQVVSRIFGGVFNFILIIVLSFYLAVQKDGIAMFLEIITPVKHEKYIADLWKRSQNKIGLWMQGQLLLAVIIGVLVFLGLTIFGVKYAFLLAVLAAVLELIPLFGPIIAAIPAILIAVTDGGTTQGLIIAGFYIIIQQFENHLIYPLVVKKVVGVPPLLVILALIIGAKLAGFLGIILSVPLAAALMEFISDVEKDKKKFLEEKV
ncbi:hypothetical protein A2442_00695 [Candidatus Campbellbacteria bacterium RIFOXYC2_FULL_35_25]|uniref:AI-2E family transporter n=1 Tax=Candidatus Campbellbacteria bacterium RIFOXYC2_FULL_35_25 TaxID=1797582 RepID=A0A1F5EJ95_9BACT|nr:MAG: hypothetical protein A2442_00695 [Candidatus Campbellbacteria bacterium RIFOXYC2_FULL_35_25]